MNHSDLVNSVAGKLGVSNAEAKRAVEAVASTIVSTVASGDDVSIAGFGKFSSKSRPARQGRNPRTGETMQIAATKACGFAPAKQFKDTLNG